MKASAKPSFKFKDHNYKTLIPNSAIELNVKT